MSKSGQTTDEAEFAPEYQNSRDLSAFETDAEPVEVRRNVTISVRFSDDEIAQLRAMPCPLPPAAAPPHRWFPMRGRLPSDSDEYRQVDHTSVARLRFCLSRRGQQSLDR